MFMDITELTVRELQEKIKRKELTAYDITKAYADRIKEKETDVQAFAQGIPLKDFTCLPARLEPIPGTNLARVEVREGKFHQVKRMFAARGKLVLELRRLRMGALFLDSSLKPGEARELTEEELKLIFS